MSYIALATDSFDTIARFYGELLGFPVVADWDRPNGRGRRFDLGGRLRVEILDNARKREPLHLPPPGDRFHLVVEVPDIDAARSRLAIQAPAAVTASWNARLFQVHDPDGVPVTFLQWNNKPGAHK
jgi:catechol 2,3-dioxygenase-like lactoylglutathione lyase family enzyme